MTYTDPATGITYATIGDYLAPATPSGNTIGAMSASFRVRYSSPGGATPQSSSWSVEGPYLLGNGPAGTFVTCGYGEYSASTNYASTTAADTRVYGTNVSSSAEKIERLKTYVADFFGSATAEQVNSENQLITGISGRIKVGSQYWAKGSIWQQVHPLLQGGSDVNIRPIRDDNSTSLLQPYSWQTNYTTTATTEPMWARWLSRKLGSTAGVRTAFPRLSVSADGTQVTVHSPNVGPGWAGMSLLVTDFAGTGYATANAASAALGLTHPANQLYPYGSVRGINGISSAGLTSSSGVNYYNSRTTLNWTRGKPFRLRLYTYDAAAAADPTTGEAWLALPGVTLWFDVEVYIPSAIGPPVPMQTERLLMSPPARTTARLRVGTSIDGGSP